MEAHVERTGYEKDEKYFGWRILKEGLTNRQEQGITMYATDIES